MKYAIPFVLLFVILSCQKKETSEAASNSIKASDIRISGENRKLKDRSKYLKKRQENRLYDGAPPVIPHRLEDGFTDRTSCMSCHKIGKMHGPNVLHEEQINCTQCHVRAKVDTLFRPSNFKKYFSHPSLKRANPIGPPYIPHRVQDRKNCAICHIDNGAREELVPRHGNLMNCTQCHVQLQQKKNNFIYDKERASSID